jgi:uncharacterized protein (TIGR02996 family)
MSERDDFLRAILANPADDAPRLVYADWLDDQGESARAEFIRVQVAMARLPEPELKCIGPLVRVNHWERVGGHCAHCAKLPGPCEYHRLEDREAELFDPDWFDPEGKTFNQVALDVDDYVPHRAYGKPVRGFVGYVRCEAAFWLAHADAITAEHPVTTVRLTTQPTANMTRDAVRPWRLPCADGADALWTWEAEWPGITFHLPVQTEPVAVEVPYDDPAFWAGMPSLMG